MTQRFCVDCRWCEDRGDNMQPRCLVEYVDLVSGVTLKAFSTCHSVRYQGPCGPAGALWEKKT